MIMKGTLMNIRSLAKQGYSQRAISRLVGVHRMTVKKYLEEGKLPIYEKIKRKSKLDEYKPLIQGWLEGENYQATRIYELLLLESYKGSYPTVQRYVSKIKEERDRIAYIRFETKPGQQAQVDFADFQIEEAEGKIKTIYCFIMALGYSRHKYVEFIEECTMPRFLACHQHAFGFFGGIPSEILYDNMKNVVIKRLAGTIQWNKTFEAFCVHYGLKPLATPPYSPWAKGKVERPIQYIREGFWRGYNFKDIEQANHDIRMWINTIAIERIHGTHKEKVAIRFEKEKLYLGALPMTPYDISEKVYRKVYKDCQISFDGNKYVVPHECVGKKILLRIQDGLIRFYKDDKMVCVYKRSTEKGKTIADPRFYQRLKEDQEQIRRKYRTPPSSKARATIGLLKSKWDDEVIKRSLSDYDNLFKEEE